MGKFFSQKSLCLLLALSVVAQPLYAWGSQGHRLVARLAQNRLKPRAKQEVARLLQPGETLESIANWADTVRNARPETKRWHYVDILLEHNNYDPARDCRRSPFGDCIINALQEEHDLLANPARLELFKLVLTNSQETRQARAEALKFLVHFIGDLHQPLHCADNHDQGGNALKVTFFGASSNLHKVWDTDILARAKTQQNAHRVDSLARATAATLTANDSFVDWAMEAHRLAKDHTYQNIPANKRLGQAYFSANRPVVDGQLSKAGLRLANLLNQLFHAS